MRPHSYTTDWADPFRAWFEDILKKNGWTREHFGEGSISNLSLAFEEGWKAAQQSGPNSESYIARRGAFARAIEACQELIRDYEAHKDADGNVTGPDYNFHEIDALKTAIVRIESAEAREPQSPATPNAIEEKP